MYRSRYVLCMMALLCLAPGAQPSVTFAASQAGSQQPALQPKTTALGPPLYVIQPGDILEILEWKEPKVSRGNVVVRPDGRISVPLAQDVLAAGLNPAQLKDVIEERFKDGGIPAPEVTVIVSAIQSYVVYVMGSVGKQGEIRSATPLTVLQALTMAGGTTQFAKIREIVILRGSGENATKFIFNFDEVITGKNFNQNNLLKSGDSIYVP
jgi:polysaccharide export outer membrane protein